MVDPLTTPNTILHDLPGIIAAVASGVAVVFGAWNKIQISSVKKTGEANHTLSNSAMAQQLLVNWETLQALSVVMHRVSAMPAATDSDHAAAVAIDVRVEAARILYQAHLLKQAQVDLDSGEAPPPLPVPSMPVLPADSTPTTPGPWMK